MKLELVMADPAGNRTALVRTPVAPSLWGGAAKKIMADKGLKAEQVGYCCPPQGDALGRLEMMGGEFCGNAARSFALLLAAERGFSKSKAVVPIEVSGCSGILPAEVDLEGKTASCPLPPPFAIEELAVLGLGTFPVVRMEGITHVILRGVEAGEEAFRAIRQSAEKSWEWEALGGMFLSEDHNTLTPVVAVKKTSSTVFESSCASGSGAVAAWLSREEGDGEREYRFTEPGGVLSARTVRQAGKLTGLTVGGKVELEPAVWWEG